MATARKLPSGNWRIQIFAGMKEGKRVYKSFTAESKKEAEYQASLFMMGLRRAKNPLNLTVGEAIDRYIDSKDSVLSPSTIRGYRQCRRLYLQSITAVKLSMLTAEAIQRAVNTDAKSHSPKTLRNAHGLLVATLAEYHPDFRPHTRLPQKIKQELNIPKDDQQIRDLLKDVSGTAMEIVILLGACAGLRRSEICALSADDVDSNTGLLNINKAMVQTAGDATGANCDWIIKGTKTYSGTRKVYIPVRVAQRILAVGAPDGRLVPINPNTVSSLFAKLRKRHGFDFTLHGLRHHAASIMLALGVPDKYAMRRLGHASTNMLKNVYQHTLDKTETELTEKINDYYDDFV